MLIVALTGNIASGKSTVAATLSARGATLIDSDAAARAAVAPGSAALGAIVTHFGQGILLADGALDRAALGRQVFANADARRALESIVHPAIEEARRVALARARETNTAIVVCDIPLLFEARLAWQFPRIVLVDAPAPIRVSRMVRDRRMRPEDAAARVRAQMPATLKRPRADIVIDNTEDHHSLLALVDGVWRQLCGWAAVAGPVRAA